MHCYPVAVDSIQQLDQDVTQIAPAEPSGVQSCAYLLELSPDWIVRRASENIHHLLGESHVTLIDEPLGRFVHGQALHDLRNLFSRLSGTTGIARAYKVRLTDEHEYVDVAFQLSGGRVVLELVPAAETYGEYFGTVAGLIGGLADARGQALLDGAARRMRALTGYDRVTLGYGNHRAQSARGAFDNTADIDAPLPAMIADTEAGAVALFPRGDASSAALLRSCAADDREALRRNRIRACARIPFAVDESAGEFRCDSRTPRSPSIELHAAAELFAQSFALLLKIADGKAGQA
jgi:hypothetical protein